MSCLSWNCRGLGNPCTVHELANLVRVKDPLAVFLMETWSNEEQLELLHCRLHFNNKLVVPSNNKGRGLALFWKNNLNLSISNYSCSHIDSVINPGTDNAWRLSFIYGEPVTHKRMATWNLLRRLHNQHSLPWCCMGDFNEIIKSEEMQGRRPRPDRQMQAFRDAIDDCNLLDMGYSGFPFTWCNNRDPPHTTWVRLDRGLANMDWLQQNPLAIMEHIDVTNSDHKCLFMSWEPHTTSHFQCKPFRFEEVWTSDEGCENTIKESWENRVVGTTMFKVANKLNQCKKGLGNWSHRTFGNISKQLAEKRRLLRSAEIEAVRSGNMSTVKSLKMEVNSLFGKEERLWRQRSRSNWLRAGDQNTRFFHGRASQRRRRNRIVGLRDEDGNWRDSSEEVVAILTRYYESIFQTSLPDQIDNAVRYVPNVITQSMNANLDREFSASEVDQALKQMAPLTAPGPDGLPPLFYQKYWHVVGPDVTKGVLSYLNSGQVLSSINHTYITLIPKVKNPEKVTEFRPISLCNVIYKLASKVIANRLKLILPNIISESQSAFVPGRLITDNILVAFETLYHMNSTRIGRDGAMALKLDMSKAYDCVE
jgi:hypothetical protein